jgi:hypothetical protein
MDGFTEEIGILVIEAAQEIFEVCGTKEDFSIQSVGSVAVFGNTNRIRFDPIKGFTPVPESCTDRFLKEFEYHYK